MNTRMLLAAVVTMFVLCQHVHAQDDEPEQAEATELEGTWEVVSWVLFGEKRESDGFHARFEGNRIYFRKGDTIDWTSNCTFLLDPSAMPATIDCHSTDPEVMNGLGIYELDGDLLRVCIRVYEEVESGTRPDRFESTEDYRTNLVLYRRVEEESE